jgi:hypothetical protein
LLLLPAAQTIASPGVVDTEERLSELPTAGPETTAQAEPFQFSMTDCDPA